MLCYKSDKLMITAAFYNNGNNNKFDYNEEKVYLLLRK